MQLLLKRFREIPDYRKNQIGYTNPSEILFVTISDGGITF